MFVETLWDIKSCWDLIAIAPGFSPGYYGVLYIGSTVYYQQGKAFHEPENSGAD